MSRRAAAVDANQAEIVKALRKVGVSVQPLHRVGGGVPDLLCGHAGKNMLLEVKDGAKVPSARTLTPDQKEWLEGWRGQWAVVTSVDDAFDALGIPAVSR